ncbi:MAG: hypothetical protein OSJ45_03955 [Lachnospiraceae bacterium]|nr:hypothetical protein [Lachnospiraceae bacterium]
MAHKNSEGYRDPTAWEGIRTVTREEKKQHEAAVANLIAMLKQIISLAGFELVGHIILKDKETGKVYK